jgi:hypothetical protein
MAYGVKYQQVASFGGRTIGIYLEKSGFEGEPTDIVLGSGTLRRSDSGPDSSELAELRPWTAEIPVPPQHSDVIDDVFGDDATWRVRQEIDGQPDLLGFINKDRWEGDEDYFSGGSVLIAGDGIGLLQGIPLVAGDGTIGTLLSDGDKSWAEWVLFILNKLETEQPVRMAVERYAYQMDQGLPSVTQEMIPPTAWVQVGVQPPSCYEVLRSLLRGVGAFIYSRYGAWHVHERRKYEAASFPVLVIPHNHFTEAAATSTDTHTARFVIPSGNAEWWHFHDGSQSSRLPRWTSAEVKYDHGPLESIINNPGFERFPQGQDEGVDEWTLHGGAEIAIKSTNRSGGLNRSVRLDNSVLTLVRSVTQPVVLEGHSLLVNPRCFRELTAAAREDSKNVGAVDARVRVIAVGVDSGTTRYLKKTAVQSIGTWQDLVGDVARVKVASEEWQELEIRSAALPETSRIRIELLPVDEIVPTGAEKKTAYTWWDDVQVIPIDGARGGAFASTRMIDYVSRSGGARRDAIVVDHGQGPTSAHRGACRLSDGTLLSDYKDEPYGLAEEASGVTREQVLLHDVLEMSRMGLKRIQMTFVRQVEVDCVTAVQVAGGLFLPVAIDENVEDAVKECTLIEIARDPFAADFDALGADGADLLTGPAGSGVALLLQQRDDERGASAVISALTTLTLDVGPGIVDRIPIELTEPMTRDQEAMKEGKQITIGGLRGGMWQMVLSADQKGGDPFLYVVPYDLGTDFIPAGSGVTPSTADLYNVLTLTRDVTFNLIRQGSLAQLTASYDEVSLDEIAVSALRERIDAGRMLERRDREGTVLEFWVRENAPKGAKRLKINADRPIFADVLDGDVVVGKTLTNPVPVIFTGSVGDAIRRSDVAEQLESLETAQGLTRTVTRAEFNAMERRLEEVTAGPVEQLTDALGEPWTSNGTPIQFSKKLRDIIPEHADELVVHGSAIQQLDDSVTLIVAGVDPNVVNLAVLDVRVGDNESEISSHTGVFASNGLDGTTNISQRVQFTEDDISINALAIAGIEANLSLNGIDATSNLATRVGIVETDTGSNATAISTLQSDLAANGINGSSNLTLAVNTAQDQADYNASSIANLSSTLSANGITGATNVSQAIIFNSDDIDALDTAIVDIGAILTTNGITNFTNIKSTVDTIGARVVVTVSGGGTLGTISLESGATGSVAAIDASQINLTGDTSVDGSFVVAGANVHITAATTFDGNVVINGILDGVTGTFSGDLDAAGGSFSGSLDAASGTFAGALDAASGSLGTLALSGDLTMAGGNYLSGAGTASFGSATIGGMTFSGYSITATAGSPAPSISVDSSNWLYLNGDNGVAITGFGELTHNGNAVYDHNNFSFYLGFWGLWSENNDGPGSGMHADLLDGYHAADFLLASGGATFSFNETEHRDEPVTGISQYRQRSISVIDGQAQTPGAWGSWIYINN